MAITSYPFDDQDTTETEYSRLFRELQDSGIADTIAGPGFAVSADASAMSVTVQPGFALLRGHAALSTAVETVPITAAAAQARTDRVILRLDPAQNSIVLATLQGTPGADPMSLTQTDTGIYELPLAQVTVTAGVVTIAAEKVLDDRRFVGSRIGAWTTATRPATPRTGQLGLNTTAGHWEYWDTTGWSDLAPVVTWATIAGKPAVFAPASHRHDFNDLDNVPAVFTPAAHVHDWASITGKPATFPAAAHTHAGSDLSTNVPINRLPVGSDAGTIAAGDHDHDARYSGSAHNHDGRYASPDHGHWWVNNANYATRSDGSDRVHGNTPAGSGWYAVWIDGNHNFCHNTSSIRFKEHVRDHPIDPAAVLALRPVLYDRKPSFNTDTGQWQPGPVDEFGLIAEEVQPHLPEIVQWMPDETTGELQVEALRYDLLPVAMLAVLRDHEARIRDLETRLRTLEARANGGDA